jgi:hypothetical protein
MKGPIRVGEVDLGVSFDGFSNVGCGGQRLPKFSFQLLFQNSSEQAAYS